MYKIKTLLSILNDRNKLLLTMSTIGAYFMYKNRCKRWTQSTVNTDWIRKTHLNTNIKSMDQIHEDYYKYCVRVVNTRRNCDMKMIGAMFGAGVCVDRNGYFVTNCHVAEDADNVFVQTVRSPHNNDKPFGTMITAKVVYVEPLLDLALIRTQTKPPDNLQALPSSHWRLPTAPVLAGEPVVTFGHPDIPYTIFNGIVSNTRRPANTISIGTVGYCKSFIGQNEQFLSHGCHVFPGVSGGPVVDNTGKLVAIHFYSLDDGTKMATSGQQVQEFVRKGKAFEIYSREKRYTFTADKSLGVSVHPFDSNLRQTLGLIGNKYFGHQLDNKGLLVLETFYWHQSSPINNYLKQFDIIIKINGLNTNSVDDLKNAINSSNELDIIAMRDEQQIEIKVKPNPLDLLVF